MFIFGSISEKYYFKLMFLMMMDHFFFSEIEIIIWRVWHWKTKLKSWIQTNQFQQNYMFESDVCRFCHLITVFLLFMIICSSPFTSNSSVLLVFLCGVVWMWDKRYDRFIGNINIFLVSCSKNASFSIFREKPVFAEFYVMFLVLKDERRGFP